MIGKWEIFLQSNTNQVRFHLASLNRIKAGKYDLWGKFDFSAIAFQADLIHQQLQQHQRTWQYQHPPLKQSVKLASAIDLHPGEWYLNYKIQQSNNWIKRQAAFTVLDPHPNDNVGATHRLSPNLGDDRPSNSLVNNYLQELETILQQQAANGQSSGDANSSPTSIHLTPLPSTSHQLPPLKSVGDRVLPPKIELLSGSNQSEVQLPNFAKDSPQPKTKTILITSKVDSSNSLIIDPTAIGKLIDRF